MRPAVVGPRENCLGVVAQCGARHQQDIRLRRDRDLPGRTQSGPDMPGPPDCGVRILVLCRSQTGHCVQCGQLLWGVQ